MMNIPERQESTGGRQLVARLGNGANLSKLAIYSGMAKRDKVLDNGSWEN
jgi:hypothetical protein